MPFKPRASRTREPIPPSAGGEPPMTTEFNRWLYGLIIPAIVALLSLMIFLNGRINLSTRRLGRITLIGTDAYCIAAAMLFGAILCHRIRFHYELYEAGFGYWRWYDKLLGILTAAPVLYLAYRMIRSVIG